LSREFPDLDLVELPGYNVKYGKNRALTVLQLISSIPKILIRIKREKAWLRSWIDLEQPELVISDNRYGLNDPRVVSIFITHQLLIRTPLGSMADRLLQRMNYYFIEKFSRCWVPDAGDSDGLAGELSHPVSLPFVPVRYIGWLSRFGAGRGGESFDLLVLLSGPEPQRTLLEKKILEQVADYTGRTVLVRGLPKGLPAERRRREAEVLPAPPQVKVYDHLAAADLEVMIRNAGQIICRSGYSTVMDLMRLGKRAIFIPTPGQTEQEYLGDYLAAKGWAICIEQKGFFLSDAMAVARELKSTALPDPATGDQLLRQEIMDVLDEIRKKR
jgi:UDP-N-acetylglucosamine transferase subunit ALG13